MFLAVLSVLAIFPIDAKAYIDAGTGSLTLQYLSSGMLLVLITLRVAMVRISRLFTPQGRQMASFEIERAVSSVIPWRK
jgi:hypothetical protein